VTQWLCYVLYIRSIAVDSSSDSEIQNAQAVAASHVPDSPEVAEQTLKLNMAAIMQQSTIGLSVSVDQQRMIQCCRWEAAYGCYAEPRWPSGNTLAFNAENPGSTPGPGGRTGRDQFLKSVERTEKGAFNPG
jgi:hypothetical protein